MPSERSRVEPALLGAARAVRHAFSQRLREIGLNMTEAALLSFLAEHGSLSQRELADRLQITPASTGAVVDALEKRGLVERRADPRDRRIRRIVLREGASVHVVEFRRVDAELREELRHGLSRHERRELARLLGVLQRNAMRAAGVGIEEVAHD
jgi:MarR family transcriptional regulator for hemolysin